MEIKTKFNVGDTVHLLHDNKAVSATVLAIEIGCYETETRINYDVRSEAQALRFAVKEAKVFATKQELLASL